MAREYPKIDPALHQKILTESILRDPDLFQQATSVDRPRVIITAGQPGAGKSKVVARAEADMGGNVVTIDPDQLREKHPQVEQLRNQHPYTWSGHTHGDASQWATELREAAVAQRKNIILDTTMPRADMIQELKALGYEVKVRAIATHRLESELGVDNRFTRDMDRFCHGRHVPEEVRSAVYKKSPVLWTTSPNRPACRSRSTTAKAGCISTRAHRAPHRPCCRRLSPAYGNCNSVRSRFIFLPQAAH